ncbi:MAG: tRNA-modifying protein YgfZ [Nitriliruptoraceae bacterium]
MPSGRRGARRPPSRRRRPARPGRGVGRGGGGPGGRRGRPGTDQDLEDARIRAGEPAWGRELAAPHLPEELGLLPTHVHLAKGCYPGQEAVARMWMLGRPRRQLAVVTPTGPVTPGWTAGTGRERVEVTSLTADGSTALAFVPASAAAGDRYGTEEEGAIEVVRVVGAEQVVPGHDPAMVRRRDRGATGPGSR